MSKKINIEDIRQNKLAHFCQFILFDKDGMVIESDHVIFDTTLLQEKPVYTWFPFMESLPSSLTILQKEHYPLRFSKIEDPAPFLIGVYDFVFEYQEIQGETYLLWSVFDYTSIYEDFRNYQQQRNNIEIQRQRFILKTGQNPENISPKNTAFDTCCIDTQSALNMAINTIIQNISPIFDHNSLVGTLDQISNYLQTIVQELPKKEIGKNIHESGLERKFSIENILYDSITYASKWDNVHIVEATISEELPPYLYGNPLDLKRILVGLIINSTKLYDLGQLSLTLYPEKFTENKCTLGIKIKINAGNTRTIDKVDLLLRFSVTRRIVELHQGEIIMESNTSDGLYTLCLLPFFMV